MGYCRRRLGVGRARGAGRARSDGHAGQAEAGTGGAPRAIPSEAAALNRSRPQAWIAWSSGKDSAWALHETRCTGDYDVVGAVTTVTDDFRRVSMHGVREELLMRQIEAAGLEPFIVRIP